jgi:two-component system response regulator RegA
MHPDSHSPGGPFLIIDDDAVFCSVLQRALTRRGLRVEVAHDASTALALARSLNPVRVVLDLKLEHESGLGLIAPLLNLREDMQIVVLTGYGSISTAVAAIKQGAMNYLAKPVDVETLLGAFEQGQTGATLPQAEPVSLRRMEWEHIQRALQEHDGNLSATARSLGMHRRTLQRKLQKRPVRR